MYNTHSGQASEQESLSDTELPQMVIEVFVHAAAPGVWRQRTEEWVWMPCAGGLSALMEAPELLFELFPFASEILLAGHHQLFAGRAVPGERFLVGVDG